MYAVVQNRAAGTGRILEDGEYRKFHESFVSEHKNREDAEKALDALAGPDIWVVFWDVGRDSGFFEKHNNLSGNFRGSMHPHATVCGEYKTRDEAMKKLASLNE